MDKFGLMTSDPDEEGSWFLLDGVRGKSDEDWHDLKCFYGFDKISRCTCEFVGSFVRYE